MNPPELLDYARGIGTQLRERLVEAEAALPAELAGSVQQAMSWALQQLSATGTWGRGNLQPSSAFWSAASDLLQRGNLQWHARSKPRGYAGDFELLHRICTGYLGDDRLGRAFDEFFQQQAAPQAVRNRSRLIADEIISLAAESPTDLLRVASVGSGPAWDLQLALTEMPVAHRRRLKLVLLDLDPHALEFAREQLTPFVVPDQLTCIQANLSRLWRLTRIRGEIRNADLVFAAGFLDYLDESHGVVFVRTLAELLGPDGRLLVFNFSHDNPSRAYMEWIGNWYLTYRSRDDLARIAAGAIGTRHAVKVAVEPAGVNLYLRVGG